MSESEDKEQNVDVSTEESDQDESGQSASEELPAEDADGKPNDA